MILYFIRHGQTDWNARKLFQGTVDIPLNETGLAQAEEAKKAVRELELDLVFASPLNRAMETARIALKERPIRIIPEPRLREREFGVLEGCDYTKTNWADLWSVRTDRGIENGESMKALYERVAAFLDELRALYPDGRILLVAHGGVYQAVLHYVLKLRGEEEWDVPYERLENAAVKCFEI